MVFTSGRHKLGRKKQNSKQNCFLLCGRRRLRGRHSLTSLAYTHARADLGYTHAGADF